MLRLTTIRRSFFLAAICASLFFDGAPRAATKTLDLDGSPANGAESQCDLNVIQTFPVKLENKVTNRTGGDAFNFAWPSAGPGGFTSSVTPGTTAGVGAKWVWTTDQSVYSFTGATCESDLCFGKTAGPDPIAGFCSLACLADGITLTIDEAQSGAVSLRWPGGFGPYTLYRSTSARSLDVPGNELVTTDLLQYNDTPPAGAAFFYEVRGPGCLTRKTCNSDAECAPATDGTCISRGPFGVPGRSLFANNVTVSSASLTSSLITFFSPPVEIFRATSAATAGGVTETFTNYGGGDITVTIPGYPPGCCPMDGKTSPQLRCGEACVSYLYDPENCGACGNVCAENFYCDNGDCLPMCDEGEDLCDGQCVRLYSDPENCGECGNSCGEGCCQSGECAPACDEGWTRCGDQCVELDDDSANCGACGNACGEGSCCSEGECTSLTCNENRELCGGECVATIQDNDNCGGCGIACGPGQCCGEGCHSVCFGNESYCGGDLCAELDNDSANCGECGNVCGDGTCCNAGACVSVCSEVETWCGDGCTDLAADPENCGACGNSCGESGCCSDGECSSECGEQSSPHGGYCPNPYPSTAVERFCSESPAPTPGICPNESPSDPEPLQCGSDSFTRHPPAFGGSEGPPPSSENEAPACVIDASTHTIEPGESATTCFPGGGLFKEIATTIVVCGDGIPGVNGTCNNAATKITTGTFNRLQLDPSISPGNAYVTPYAVHVTADSSNDGMLQPGETANLVIDVLNAGPLNITQASAALSALAVDLSDDGLANPVGITVGGAPAVYGTILGTPPAPDCTAPPIRPSSNATVYPITVPASHPGDTSHPGKLAFSGTVNGSPFTMDVPIVLGIADKCVFSAHARDFDGLDGLASPMAKLVPEGEPVPFPSNTFSAGQTRPLKLRMSCDGASLGWDDIDAPEIVGLSEATRGPLDLSLLQLNGDNGPNPNDPFFRYTNHLTGPPWIYNMRTDRLGTGSFTMTIRIAGRKNYVTGFVLR